MKFMLRSPTGPCRRRALKQTRKKSQTQTTLTYRKRVHANSDIVLHPAAVIAVFHSNVRNRRMQAKMDVKLPKTVNGLYTLADKCAHAEEGR